MTDTPFTVLVLCTGNSARSILGEALFNHLGQGRVQAFSAGSKPKGVPHPGALRLLARRGIDIATFRSKSWDEFTAPGAPGLIWRSPCAAMRRAKPVRCSLAAHLEPIGACLIRLTSPAPKPKWMRPSRKLEIGRASCRERV